MKQHPGGAQGVGVDGYLLEGTHELEVVGAGARLARSEGGRVARNAQATDCGDGAARVGDAVHVKDHFAIGFVTDADQVMPGVVRGNVASGHVRSTGPVANEEAEPTVDAIESELLDC